MVKVSLDEVTLYIIRSAIPMDDGTIGTCYYESPMSWNSLPEFATIFRSYDIAEEHMITSYRVNGSDGEFTEIVPLFGELIKKQSGKPPKVKKD